MSCAAEVWCSGAWGGGFSIFNYTSGCEPEFGLVWLSFFFFFKTSFQDLFLECMVLLVVYSYWRYFYINIYR